MGRKVMVWGDLIETSECVPGVFVGIMDAIESTVMPVLATLLQRD